MCIFTHTEKYEKNKMRKITHARKINFGKFKLVFKITKLMVSIHYTVELYS